MTMSKYIPNTTKQRQEMLEDIGAASVDSLFSDLPEAIRLRRDLEVPNAHSELELLRHMNALARKNTTTNDIVCFLGAGAYDHYIPTVIDHLLLRQEFYTAYTPYQPEVSQGTLQAIFEYQTLICELTGMDVANASMYDVATALGEAANMACAATRRGEVIVARTVHPQSREVLATYCKFRDYKVAECGYTSRGQLDLSTLEAQITKDTAAVIVQSPNFLGPIEDLAAIAEVAHKAGALLIVSVDPISLAILKSPGECGADIVVGEGQSMGNSLSYGGPYLGFFATTTKLLRSMPGRVVGATTDKFGRRAFVLTMQTREQHIRRDKATSNICTNNALNALAATIYLSVMGKHGLQEVATQCLHKAHYTYNSLLSTGLFTPVFDAPFFKEFAVKSKVPVKELNEKLQQQGILGGYEVGRDYKELADGWLVAVTEVRTKADIDALVRKVEC